MNEGFALTTTELFALLGIVFIAILLAVLFFIPTDKSRGKTDKRRKWEEIPEGKDWREA